MLDKILIGRTLCGRHLQTSFVIVDSKSIKNTDTAKEKDFDSGKKVSGIKLQLAVDILGLPQAIYVTKADVTDRNGAIEMFISTKNNLVCKICLLILVIAVFANVIRQILLCSVEVIKKSDLHTFKVMPKRWTTDFCLA